MRYIDWEQIVEMVEGPQQVEQPDDFPGFAKMVLWLLYGGSVIVILEKFVEVISR